MSGLAGEKENMIFQRFIKMTKKEATAYKKGDVFTDVGIREDTKDKRGLWVQVILYQKKDKTNKTATRQELVDALCNLLWGQCLDEVKERTGYSLKYCNKIFDIRDSVLKEVSSKNPDDKQ